jgi:hypothetical protein
VGKVDIRPEDWSVRLLTPLALWVVLAVASWHGLAIAPVPPFLATALTFLLLFVTSAGYVFAACAGGPFPRQALWVLAGGAGGALLLGVTPLAADLGLVRNALLLASVPVAGDSIARMVEKRSYLLPVLLIATLADIWSVFYGPSLALVESGAVKHAIITYPVAGRPDLPLLPQVVPAVGVMDWVFLAFLVQAGVRHQLSLRRLAIATGIGLLAAGLLLFLYQVPVPLLATLAPATALLWLPEILPTPREALITLLFALAMGVVFYVLSFFLHAPDGLAEDSTPGPASMLHRRSHLPPQLQPVSFSPQWAPPWGNPERLGEACGRTRIAATHSTSRGHPLCQNETRNTHNEDGADAELHSPRYGLFRQRRPERGLHYHPPGHLRLQRSPRNGRDAGQGGRDRPGAKGPRPPHRRAGGGCEDPGRQGATPLASGLPRLLRCTKRGGPA